MKRLLFSLLVFGVALVAPVSARADDGEFTVADVRGSYGFSWDGTVGAGTSAPVPASAVGLLVADGEGKFTESVRTLSLDGSVSHQTATGTYTVNRNGTGSATFSVNFGGGVVRTETFDFVIVNNDREAHFIGTDPGVVIRGVAVKQ
jgi:putative salt-induced outer membrane protein YdiY